MKSRNVTSTKTRSLLRDQSLQAVLNTWTGLMASLGSKIAALPPRSNVLFEGWGFVFALDSLRYNEPAVRALMRIVNDLKERPTYEEVFQIVDSSLAVREEVSQLLANRRRDGVGLKEWGRKRKKLVKVVPSKTTGPIGFVRGN